jgi:hypothetical protein
MNMNAEQTIPIRWTNWMMRMLLLPFVGWFATCVIAMMRRISTLWAFPDFAAIALPTGSWPLAPARQGGSARGDPRHARR